MRILYLGNNWVGWQILEWLKAQQEEIVGMVVHPREKRKYGAELIQAAALPQECICDGARLHSPEVLDRIRELRPDIGVSVLFDYILRPAFLSLFPRGVINVHPGLLPYNRGQYPNVWSIVDGTPAGVTLHYVDDGIDTGDILAQQVVPVEPVDTGETLYRKLEKAALERFASAWPGIREGRIVAAPQRHLPGTVHRTRDVQAMDEIDLDRPYMARALINILRARTFPPYRGAYFRANGKRVYLRLQLENGE